MKPRYIIRDGHRWKDAIRTDNLEACFRMVFRTGHCATSKTRIRIYDTDPGWSHLIFDSQETTTK